jgi:ABC-type transport system involved in multi-copper enzyme maturation permease subunit
LFIGPVFTREVAIAPRRTRIYVARTAYGIGLLILMATAWLVLTGTQVVRDVGDLARFGTILLQILAPLQLALAVFFSAMLSASAVSQEKDRKTLILLLLTNLSNSELVLGKLFAALLHVLVLTMASLPLFMLATWFGGVSFDQIARVFVVTVISVMACGSLGSVIALWREKTFQSLAMTVLVLVLWLGVWEMVGLGALGGQWLGMETEQLALAFSPWHAIQEATRPSILSHTSGAGVMVAAVRGIEPFVIAGLLLTTLLNGFAIAMVRVWNPSRETRQATREEETWNRESIWGAEYDAERSGDETRAAAKPRPMDVAALASPQRSRTRQVWDNPIVWREIRTWAYGRKILFVRFVYLVLFVLAASSLYWAAAGAEVVATDAAARALVPLLFLSLVLVNAQAVTSLTSERDGKALDLLLVSDLTPREFVFGKLGGAFYNTKEMVLLPAALCGYLWWIEVLNLESLIYMLLGLGVLYGFVAMLGVHAGMHYANSRSAIGISLGTVFFLFVGVATCMRMMVAFSGSFEAQFQPFFVFMVGGGVGLYVSLGARNPSKAIGVASFLCPLATFYAMTSFLLDKPYLAFIATAAAYGFTTVAMVIPAIDEFDVATGRTTIGEQ